MFLEAKFAPLFISLAKPRALHFYTAQLKFDTSNLDTYCHYWCHNCLTIVSQLSPKYYVIHFGKCQPPRAYINNLCGRCKES